MVKARVRAKLHRKCERIHQPGELYQVGLWLRLSIDRRPVIHDGLIQHGIGEAKRLWGLLNMGLAAMLIEPAEYRVVGPTGKAILAAAKRRFARLPGVVRYALEPVQADHGKGYVKALYVLPMGLGAEQVNPLGLQSACEICRRMHEEKGFLRFTFMTVRVEIGDVMHLHSRRLPFLADSTGLAATYVTKRADLHYDGRTAYRGFGEQLNLFCNLLEMGLEIDDILSAEGMMMDDVTETVGCARWGWVPGSKE